MHFFVKARGLTNKMTLNRNMMGRRRLIRCFKIGIQSIKKETEEAEAAEKW